MTQIDDSAQREDLGHDAQGRLVRRAVTLKATGKTYLSTYRYRADGTLVGQTLPDGRELVYERDGLGQVLGLRLKTAALPDWLSRGTVLASGLRRDLTGPAAITYGNGIEGLWQRSAQGVLARVVYRRPGQAKETGAVQAWLEQLLPQARAQAVDGVKAEAKANVKADTQAEPATTPAIGALSLPDDPAALWDSRLVYDAQGNVVVVRHSGALVRPAPTQALPSAQTARWTQYAYDGQNQLLQAWQQDQPAGLTLAQASSGLTPEQARIWRYLQDHLGNRLLMQGPQGPQGLNDHQGSLLKIGYGRSNAVVAVNAAAGEPQQDAGLPGQDPLRQGRTWQWNPDGTLAAVRQDGQPLARYAYNHEGLRVSKTVGGQASHTLYDTQRHRLADLDAQGRIVRQYVWLGDQLVALLDTPVPAAPAAETGWFAALWQALTTDDPRMGYVHANHLGAPVAVTDAQARVVWQADYAPYGERVSVMPADDGSDADTVGGKAGALRLDLRLPGQWADAESGLHYNDQRYYDPRLGRYISADPLGAAGGVNRFAYVENNPVGFTDPLGLTLFAFDGTGNTNVEAELGPNDSVTNVWRFRQAYRGSNRHYITGVGMRDPTQPFEDIRPEYYAKNTTLDWMSRDMPLNLVDQGGNYSGPARIDKMIQYLNAEAEELKNDNQALIIDVIGFSRGAAQARAFVNRVTISQNFNSTTGAYTYQHSDGTSHCQKLEFRFMGLFDTVLSTNLSWHMYSLPIPSVVRYAAHAVALNEYRDTDNTAIFPIYTSLYDSRVSIPWQQHWGGFPLESIGAPSMAPGKVRIEKGFLGSHADIGGGYRDGDLSIVALKWMTRQAKNAGLQMESTPAISESEANIHDKSNAIQVGNPIINPRFQLYSVKSGSMETFHTEDRDVNGSPSGHKQRTMIFNGSSMKNSDTHQFINYRPRDHQAPAWDLRNPRNFNQTTGTVNMKGYQQWLISHGYEF